MLSKSDLVYFGIPYFTLNASHWQIPAGGAVPEQVKGLIVGTSGWKQGNKGTRLQWWGGASCATWPELSTQCTSSHYGQSCWKRLPWVRRFLWVLFSPPSNWKLQSDTSLGSPHAENSSHSTNRTQAPQTWRLSLSKEHYGRIKQTLVNGFPRMLVWYEASRRKLKCEGNDKKGNCDEIKKHLEATNKGWAKKTKRSKEKNVKSFEFKGGK